MTTPTPNTPEDESGTGPVTLGDRTSPEGSPGSNQAKTEPMPPSGSHQEPLVPPELGDMNVGAGDPQAPSHPALVAPVVAPSPATATGSSTPEGTAQRAPGSLGSTPSGEQVETDLAASAVAMSPAADPEPGDAPGSSEEQDVVRGARTPEA
ncbi:MAG: hypothetical protein EPN99_01160 [Frankiales bacterium]|nr:MAG: hypothetical protein EPN99_01160 [Frankiales bacterium]